jgi:hypothetical protein
MDPPLHLAATESAVAAVPSLHRCHEKRRRAPSSLSTRRQEGRPPPPRHRPGFAWRCSRQRRRRGYRRRGLVGAEAGGRPGGGAAPPQGGGLGVSTPLNPKLLAIQNCTWEHLKRRHDLLSSSPSIFSHRRHSIASFHCKFHSRKKLILSGPIRLQRWLPRTIYIFLLWIYP